MVSFSLLSFFNFYVALSHNFSSVQGCNEIIEVNNFVKDENSFMKAY